ncbi:hypothetical protein CLOM_g11041, partial [Closterium sp. NIES-68]
MSTVNPSLLSCLLRGSCPRIASPTRDPRLRSMAAATSPRIPLRTTANPATAAAAAAATVAILTAPQISTVMCIRAATFYGGPCHVCSSQHVRGLLVSRRARWQTAAASSAASSAASASPAVAASAAPNCCAPRQSTAIAPLLASPSSGRTFVQSSDGRKGWSSHGIHSSHSSHSRRTGGGGVACSAAGSGAGRGEKWGETWGTGRGNGGQRGRLSASGGGSWLGDGGLVEGRSWEEIGEGEEEDGEEEEGGKGRRGKDRRKGTRHRGAKKQAQMAVAEAYRRHYVAAVTAEKEDELAAWQQRMRGWPRQRLAEEGFALFNLAAAPKGRFFKKRIVQFTLAQTRHGGWRNGDSRAAAAGASGGAGGGGGLLPQHHLLSQ